MFFLVIINTQNIYGHILKSTPVPLTQEVKPSGTEADEKAVAAMFSLWKSRDFYFGGICDLWKSCTLQRGLLYIRKSDNLAFVSLGFVEYVAIGWGLERVHSNTTTKNYFTTPNCVTHNDAKGNLYMLSCTGLSSRNITDQTEEFAGIPFKFCHWPCCEFSVSNAILFQGLVFKVSKKRHEFI